MAKVQVFDSNKVDTKYWIENHPLQDQGKKPTIITNFQVGSVFMRIYKTEYLNNSLYNEKYEKNLNREKALSPIGTIPFNTVISLTIPILLPSKTLDV